MKKMGYGLALLAAVVILTTVVTRSPKMADASLEEMPAGKPEGTGEQPRTDTAVLKRERLLRDYYEMNKRLEPQVTRIENLLEGHGITNLEAVYIAHYTLYNIRTIDSSIAQKQGQLQVALERGVPESVADPEVYWGHVLEHHGHVIEYLQKEREQQRSKGTAKLQRIGITNQSLLDQLFSLSVTNFSPPTPRTD